MKTLQTGDRPTSLAQAIDEISHADKTIHMLTYLDDENKRRRTLQQLNRREGRHALARNVFHGKDWVSYETFWTYNSFLAEINPLLPKAWV